MISFIKAKLNQFYSTFKIVNVSYSALRNLLSSLIICSILSSDKPFWVAKSFKLPHTGSPQTTHTIPFSLSNETD